MATGTFYLRPSADISVEHSLYPEGSTSAYMLINEETSDGEATYIYKYCYNEYSATSSFKMNGEYPDKIPNITSAKLVINGDDDGSKNAYREIKATVKIGSTSFEYSNTSNPHISTDASDIAAEINNNLNNGIVPNVEISIYSYLSDNQDVGTEGLTVYITQVYIELTYEFDLNIYTKSNGVWTQADAVYQKQGGVWTEITGDEGKSVLRSHLIRHAITLKNLVPAMSTLTFDNGEMSTTYAKYGSSSLCITGIADDNEEYARSTQTFPLNPAHIYYACVEVYQETKLGSVDLFFPAASPSIFGGQATGDAGTWKKCANVTGRTSFTEGSYPVRLDFNNGGIAGAMWFDGLMIIDLTAAFGAGNEPTNAWCQENIPYFEGEWYIEPFN